MQEPGFFERLALAFGLFFKLLFDATLAARVKLATTGEATPVLPEPSAPEPVATEPSETEKAAPALQLLGALQREGRFVDFLLDDVTGVDDADIGAAARIVHAGSKKVVQAWFGPEAVWPGEEGATITVEAGFDAARIRLSGNIEGEAPHRGTLVHHGWRATRAKIPQRTGAAAPEVLAPAEVEL